MSKLFLCGLVVVSVGYFSPLLYGNSASPFPIEVKQPDGEPLVLYLRGTEKLNWYEYVPEATGIARNVPLSPSDAKLASEPGYTVVQNTNGRYVFAQLDAQGNWQPTDVAPGGEPPANLQRRLTPPRQGQENMMRSRLPERNVPKRGAAPVGTVKNLVVLLRFADHVNRTLPTKSDFEQLFNSQTPVAGITPTGSVNTFYKENSYGKLDLQSTVVDWVTLPKKESYYADGNSGLSIRVTEAIRDGLDVVKSRNLVDFTAFDNENGGRGDGWIDAITFVHSGYAAEFGGDAGGATKEDRIWSHRWSMSPWTDSTSRVKVSDYNINPGLWSTSGSTIGRIGVICHELGHFFGLPDLYDYSNQGEGCGSWCLMANSWGFDGTQLHPPHMSAWSKISLSWNSAEVIAAAGTYSLDCTAISSAKIYRLNYPSGNADEYLLIENRHPVGEFDGGIPAGTGGTGGLAVWHIDDSIPENDRPGFTGSPGFPAEHYKVGLIQADGKWELEKGINRGEGNDVFRKGSVETLSDSTTPSHRSFAGAKLDDIHSISAAGQSMSFQYGVIASDGGDVGGSASTILAGKVHAMHGTSHSVNFSDDAKAATIITDRLVGYSFGNRVQVSHASFVLPAKDPSDAAKVQVHLRGFLSSASGSATSVVLSVNGATVVIDPQVSISPSSKQKPPAANQSRFTGRETLKPVDAEDLDFEHELTIPLSGADSISITVVLLTELLNPESGGAYVAVDSIDLEIVQ